jgi:hypothetical protein
MLCIDVRFDCAHTRAQGKSTGPSARCQCPYAGMAATSTTQDSACIDEKLGMTTNRKSFSIIARLHSFRYAIRGIGFMLTTQHNAWVHLVLTIVVCAGMVCRTAQYRV